MPHKFVPNHQETINEVIDKLLEVDFIIEIQYP